MNHRKIYKEKIWILLKNSAFIPIFSNKSIFSALQG